MEWLFDGIGTEIVSIIISLIIGVLSGGALGYKIGISKVNIKQKQNGGNNSTQTQIGVTHYEK